MALTGHQEFDILELSENYMRKLRMIDVSDIHPLTGFLRDHKVHLERLRATGRPEVLTLNGRARVVVQDAEAYQKLMDIAEAAETEALLRKRLSSLDGGEEGVPLEDLLGEMRKKLGIGQ